MIGECIQILHCCQKANIEYLLLDWMREWGIVLIGMALNSPCHTWTWVLEGVMRYMIGRSGPPGANLLAYEGDELT